MNIEVKSQGEKDSHSNSNSNNNSSCCNWSSYSSTKKAVIIFSIIILVGGAVVLGVALSRMLNPQSTASVQVTFSKNSLTKYYSGKSNHIKEMFLSSSSSKPYVWNLPASCILQAPIDWDMKMIAVYLSEDIDPITYNNIGQNSIIWMNPQCNGNIGTCDVYDAPNLVSDYFNFSDSALVNSVINSQYQQVIVGTYRYARMEFCKVMPGSTLPASANNIKFFAGNMTSYHSFSYPACTVTFQLPTPLTISKGQRVTINLAYSLDQVVTYCPSMSAASNPNCNSQGWCTKIPDFVPTARVD